MAQLYLGQCDLPELRFAYVLGNNPSAIEETDEAGRNCQWFLHLTTKADAH
jgi:hypothetical protein